MKRRVFMACACAFAMSLCLGLMGCGQDESYEPKTLTPTIDTPVVGESGTLRVGVDAQGGAPFVTSSDATMEGFDIDMAAALADELGLKLKVVNVGPDAATALKNGEVDIVMSLSATDASSAVWLSDAYVETGVALLANAAEATAPVAGESPMIAAQSSSASAWAVENSFGDDCLESKADLTSAFSAVETGEAEYVAADAVIGTYAALYQNVDLAPVALLGSAGGYFIGVSASNADLQTAISNALTAVLDNGIANVVRTKWLGTTLDLSALDVIEVSSSAAPSTQESADGEGAAAGEEKPASESAASDTPSTDGSTAGSNAVLPGSI